MVCTDESICREGMETQMYRMYLWTRWGKARVGWTKRVALTYTPQYIQTASGKLVGSQWGAADSTRRSAQCSVMT